MNQATQAKSITVVVDAFSTNDFEDGPAYAAFVVNQDFLSRIDAVRSVAERLNLSHAGLSAYPEQWGPGSVEDNLRLQDCELIIDKTGHSYFEAMPKDGAVIQSRGQEFSHISEVFAEANDGDIVYLSDQSDDLKEMYLDDISEAA